MRLSVPCVALFAASFVAAVPTLANNVGIFGKSGRDPESGTCTQCHLGNNGSPPTVTVTGLESGLTPGGVANVAITVTTNDPSGGKAEAACPDRCAGFGAAVDTGAGAFIVPDGSPVQVNTKRDEATHIAKSAFVNGSVTYKLLLTGLANGDHTLFVAGNDVDGEAATGDRVTAIKVPFHVATAAAGGTDKPATCAAAGAFPVIAVVALFALRRRRRSNAAKA